MRAAKRRPYNNYERRVTNQIAVLIVEKGLTKLKIYDIIATVKKSDDGEKNIPNQRYPGHIGRYARDTAVW